jgi:energy-coupling factor transporter ATP-binding protein EcfA2
MTRRQQGELGSPQGAPRAGDEGETAGGSRGAAGLWPANPFVGLRPFEASEGLLFFGRRDQTMELLERLHKTRFLSVVGSSGCGKSSLIRAGLIPKLKAGFLVEERDRWVIAAMKPGDAPLENLAASMLEAAGEGQGVASTDEFVEAIRTSGAQAVTRRVAPFIEHADANVLLLIDQFEEIFRFGLHTDSQERRDEAADFVSIVLALAKQRELPFYVVTTMRSDFLGDCDNFYGLPEAMNRSQYLVPRLTRRQRQEAIEGPVRLFGSSISPRLLDRLLNDVGEESDQLPVMQHALMRTWEDWEQGRRGPLDLANYEAVGTIKDALSGDADKALEGMTAEELWITQRMFQALTDRDARGRRIRRPAHLSEIEAITGAGREKVLEIIERFRSGGRSFVNLGGDKLGGDPVIDISHESLIRQWKRLGDWVDREAESRATYLRVADTAALHKEKKAKLWGNPDLQIALDWREKVKPNRAWAERYHPGFDAAMSFLDKSRTYRRLKLAVAFALLLIACAAFVVDNYRRHRAQIAEAFKDTEAAREDRVREQHLREALEHRVEETGSFIAGDPGVYNIPYKVVGFIRIRRLPDGDIELSDDWIKEYIVPVDVPELRGKVLRGEVRFFKGGVDQLKAVFKEIREKGLLDRVLSVDYTYIPPGGEVIKGFKRTDGISPHSLGIAIDINKSYNPAGRVPPGAAEKGSVLELKPIFENHGFAWGGRVDPSHFQIKNMNRPASEPRSPPSPPLP